MSGSGRQARAEHLGSTALTVRVRCTCGRKNDFDRAEWEWRGVALCRGCGSGVLFASLLVVDAREAKRMVTAHRPTETELRALRRLERLVRDFLGEYDSQPRWLWAPATVRTAEQMRPLLAELDEARAGRAAAPAEDAPAEEQAGEAGAAAALDDEANGTEADDADRTADF